VCVCVCVSILNVMSTDMLRRLINCRFIIIIIIIIIKTKTTEHIVTKLGRWIVHDTSWSPILLEVRRSSVKVGASLHSYDRQASSLTLFKIFYVYNVSVAECLLSRKFINVFDKRLSVSPCMPSTTNSDGSLHLKTIVTPAGLQTKESDERTYHQSSLKETSCLETNKSDVYGGSDVSGTQAHIPLKKTVRRQGETSEPVDTVDMDSRTIYVHSVPDDLADVLEAWFESSKHGGGTVDKYCFDADNHVAVVTFADIQGLNVFLLYTSRRVVIHQSF